MTDRFTQVISTYGPRLARDMGFTVEQVAGVLGANGGWESGEFLRYQEIGSGKNSGGRGWFQWTAKRRVLFLSYCKVHGFAPQSDEASYNYLLMDLHGAYASVVAAVKRCKTMEAAAEVFERRYEAAGKPAMSRRIALGRRALGILRPGHPAALAPARKPKAAPMAKKAKPKVAAVKKHAAPVHHSVHHAAKR